MGARRAALVSANEFWVGGLRRLGHVWNYGTPVYERDWDVLLLLDACRYDLMRDVAAGGDYPFLEAMESVYSAASMSSEWMEKNFADEYDSEVANTAYVSGNPFSRELDGDRFARFDEVWRYGWDDDFGGIPPRRVTDRAIAAGREGDYDRLIVHYMQPHVPFREMPDTSSVNWGDPEENFGVKRGAEGEERGIWHRYRDGDLAHDAVWDAYRDNLEWVLDDVALLLENLDADTAVISSDHANAMGEWWCYGHPDYAPVPALKRVPWVETTGTDERTYEPTLEPDEEQLNDDEVSDRLEALGYK
ncbi:hypothetical protein [Haloferax marisrubri]|nr:hypothetical protein [Haloferax marisrubri]